MGLPDELVHLLKQHHEQQAREREVAAELWHRSDYVFTAPTGEPLHPRTDHSERRLLDRAGVSERRLHDARHTAATVLLLLGVPERTVMGVMGWSNTAMAARYQHITATIRRDVADRVGDCCGNNRRARKAPPSWTLSHRRTVDRTQLQPEMQPDATEPGGTDHRGGRVFFLVATVIQ